MLYVHALMGDGAPGEVDPAALGPDVVALYARIARDAARYHGPYRIEVELPDDARVGAAGDRRRSACGRPPARAVPNLRLRSARRAPGRCRRACAPTRAGVARVALTPTRPPTGVRLEVGTTVASTLPRVFAPATPAAARNAQRLAAPASQALERAVDGDGRAQAPLTRRPPSPTPRPPAGRRGRAATASRIGGAPRGCRGDRRRPPLRPVPHAPAEIRCDGAPAWEGTLAVDGPGDVHDAAPRA